MRNTQKVYTYIRKHTKYNIVHRIRKLLYYDGLDVIWKTNKLNDNMLRCVCYRKYTTCAGIC